MVYFELDATGALSEVSNKKAPLPPLWMNEDDNDDDDGGVGNACLLWEKVFSREFPERVTCLDLGMVPAGRIRSPFLAVGSDDHTVRILSTEEPHVLGQRGLLSVSARPESVCLSEMKTEQHDQLTSLYINVGLSNGILQRLLVDPTEGTLSDSRQRFLGPRPVKLIRLAVQGSPGVLAISSRSWMSYNHQGRYFLTPLSYQSLECAASFANEYIPEGVIAVSGNSLKILTVS